MGSRSFEVLRGVSSFPFQFPFVLSFVSEVPGLKDTKNKKLPKRPDSDDEDDIASVGDSDTSSDEPEETFAFDDYDVDEAARHRPAHGLGDRARMSSDDDVLGHVHGRRHGALLWSSHWFFLNRKLKRILFVSVWARTRGLMHYRDEMEEEYGNVEKVATIGGERFLGWEGAIGLGARAMGLSASV